MRTPSLFWLCAAYLLVSTTFSALAFSVSFPRYLFVVDKIEGLIALTSYAVGTLAFICRRKIAMPLLTIGMVVGIGGFIWAISTRGGFGPNFSHPWYVIGRLGALVILLAIILYSRHLGKIGVLK